MATSEGDGEMRNRTQQSPLASQRAKEQGQPQTGRFATWFPLSAKEGFNQWVSSSYAPVKSYAIGKTDICQ
jgi:cardiolipin-specific phospholipase